MKPKIMTKPYGKIYQNKTNVSITPFDIYNLYPVGSIYMSVNSTNPSNYFGGTWEQIKGRFLLGTGANDANSTDYWGGMSAGQYDAPAGQKGGECRHQLSIEEMPSHNHPYNQWIFNGGSASGVHYGYGWQANTGVMYNNMPSDWGNIGNTGGNQPHNNMPPYLAVYIWKRIG